jgi:hypothetical protein
VSSPSVSAVSPAAPAQRFALRHVQLSRAAIAAIAAIMITFSRDHSAAVGLAVFSGFGIATALVLFAAGWLTYPAGRRAAPVAIGAFSLVAGMLAGVGPWRSSALFFGIIIVWALATGVTELVAGLHDRRRAEVPRAEARDTLTVGVITLALAAGTALVPAGYALEYTIAEADATYTLTGTVIAVGVFGAYAAIVAVYLAIAGFSPRQPVAASTPEPARSEDPA